MTDNGEVTVRRINDGRKPGLRERGEGRIVVLPLVDIRETPDAYLLDADMPGASKETISVLLEAGKILIKGSTQPSHPASARILVSEIQATDYARSFTLGDGINREAVDARYENGVLTVKLYKSEAAKPREITIQ